MTIGSLLELILLLAAAYFAFAKPAVEPNVRTTLRLIVALLVLVWLFGSGLLGAALSHPLTR